MCSIIIHLNEELKQRIGHLLQAFGVRKDGGPQHGLVTSDLVFYENTIKVRYGSQLSLINFLSYYSIVRIIRHRKEPTYYKSIKD